MGRSPFVLTASLSDGDQCCLFTVEKTGSERVRGAPNHTARAQSPEGNGRGYVWGSFLPRKQLLEVSGQALGWDCFQILTLSSAILAHCACSGVAQKMTVPDGFEAGMALAEIQTNILGLTTITNTSSA